MFIIIPLILIFVSSAYLYVNSDLSFYTQISIYIFMVVVVIGSLYIAKIVKDDFNKQELNLIIVEIQRLQKLLDNSTDKVEELGLQNEIDKLTLEYESKANNV